MWQINTEKLRCDNFFIFLCFWEKNGSTVLVFSKTLRKKNWKILLFRQNLSSTFCSIIEGVSRQSGLVFDYLTFNYKTPKLDFCPGWRIIEFDSCLRQPETTSAKMLDNRGITGEIFAQSLLFLTPSEFLQGLCTRPFCDMWQILVYFCALRVLIVLNVGSKTEHIFIKGQF